MLAKLSIENGGKEMITKYYFTSRALSHDTKKKKIRNEAGAIYLVQGVDLTG